MKELNEMELREVEGGFIIWAAVIGAIVVSVFNEVIGDWKNFERGLTGQPCK